ncbi:hypothetical protein N2152v2_006680 [Parachlorella kessleri]
MAGVPPEVKAMIGAYSNEAKLALLERRLTIPPSPAASAGDTRGTSLLNQQNSVHSCQSARVQPTVANTPSASGRSKHTLDAEDGHSLDGVNQPSKRRRVQQQLTLGGGVGPNAGQAAAAGTAATAQQQQQQQQLSAGPRRGASPPTTSQLARPSLSPFLAAADKQQQQQHPGKLTPSSKQKQRNSISRYFATVNGGGPGGSDALVGSGGARLTSTSPPAQPVALAPVVVVDTALQEEARTLREDNQRLELDLATSREELERVEEARAAAQGSLARLEQEQADVRERAAQREALVRSTLLRLVTQQARQEREQALQRLQAAAPRLGCLGVRRKGITVEEVWEDGQAFKDLRAWLQTLAEQRESIETARKAAKRRLPLPGHALPERTGSGAAAAGEASNAAAGVSQGTLHPDDWLMQEEVYKARLSALKREEEMVRQDAARLEAEKFAHMRELKRVKDEEGSRFGSFPVMHDRYLLMNLLGRGGFSEVYKAFDLVELREVACKIHQLNPQWSEAKKASYVKHTMREYQIHRNLQHPRIVSLLGIFEIDNNTFGTVLELCEGGDLDSYLKQHEALPEKEAKTIVAQVLAGLSYLQPHRIIHYDLKPANILFDRLGGAKITDFGLSKIVDDGHTQGVELTSQGAGTYWYLPPECFEVQRTPIINNKVDVWAVGVILYQMLFGKRPFGHELSQEQILRNEVMLNAREVQFPSKPAVSAEGKDFIRNCLAYRPADRFDVQEAALCPYLSFKKKPKENAGGAATNA